MDYEKLGKIVEQGYFYVYGVKYDYYDYHKGRLITESRDKYDIEEVKADPPEPKEPEYVEGQYYVSRLGLVYDRLFQKHTGDTPLYTHDSTKENPIPLTRKTCKTWEELPDTGTKDNLEDWLNSLPEDVTLIHKKQILKRIKGE